MLLESNVATWALVKQLLDPAVCIISKSRDIHICLSIVLDMYGLGGIPAIRIDC